MPLKFWDEAFLTTTYLINLLPSQVLNFRTPTEVLFKEQPNYNDLCVFGYACWPNLRPYNAQKLSFRSIRCIFLGYSSQHKSFNCLEVSFGRVYISRDVVFYDQIFPFANLHPNADAFLRKEILLLPSHLLGDVNCVDSNVTNIFSSDDDQDDSNVTNILSSDDDEDDSDDGGGNCGISGEVSCLKTTATPPEAAPDPSV